MLVREMRRGKKKVMARCVEARYGHVDRMIQRWTYFQYCLDPVRTCLPYIQSRMLHVELNEAPEWCIHRPVPASVSRTALKIMHGCLAGWRWCSKTTLTPHLCPPCSLQCPAAKVAPNAPERPICISSPRQLQPLDFCKQSPRSAHTSPDPHRQLANQQPLEFSGTTIAPTLPWQSADKLHRLPPLSFSPHIHPPV
jgi:hypothetical protein